MRRRICGIIMICFVTALNTCAVFLFALTVMKPEEGHFAEVQNRFKHYNTSVNLEKKKKSPKYKDGKHNQYIQYIQYQNAGALHHMLTRSISTSLSDHGFTNVLVKCHKIAGHFKYRGASSPASAPETRGNPTLEMIKRLNQKVAVFLHIHDWSPLVAAAWRWVGGGTAVQMYGLRLDTGSQSEEHQRCPMVVIRSRRSWTTQHETFRCFLLLLSTG